MSQADRMTVTQARAILGVGPDADAAVLRAAYTRAVKAAHPDLGGGEETLRGVVEAYRFLQYMADIGEEDAPFTASPAGPRLEITPSVAILGGRVAIRLPDGRRVRLTLPAGLRNGDMVRAAGTALTVTVRGRPGLFVSGDDICMTVKASVGLLRDGGRLKIKTPTGTRLIWIPRQQTSSPIVRVPGQGLPARGKHPQGALILKLSPESGKSKPSKAKLKRFSSEWAAA